MEMGKDHMKTMQMFGQMALRVFVERINHAEAVTIHLKEPRDRVTQIPGPLSHYFVFPKDLRVFIQYSDVAQFVN